MTLKQIRVDYVNLVLHAYVIVASASCLPAMVQLLPVVALKGSLSITPYIFVSTVRQDTTVRSQI